MLVSVVSRCCLRLRFYLVKAEVGCHDLSWVRIKNSVEEAVLLCLHTISLWVFAKPYFICANFFSRKDIFFSLYMHRKREGNFSKPAVFLETLAVLTFFFFFPTFVSFCFLVLLLKWRQQSMVWCLWCSSKEKGWRSVQWDGPASVEAVRFLGPIRMPLRLFCLLACKIFILCL